MATKQEKMALREQGLTYREIAEHLGISHQAVAATLSGCDPRKFHLISESQCAYPGLRNWMNDNKVTNAELVRRCGLTPCSNSFERMRGYLCRRAEPRKRTIDKILSVTGLTYEEAFGG